jgi:diguanylate cyclase (GGDEF)-like protein/PAS domain S-box-containing protein
MEIIHTPNFTSGRLLVVDDEFNLTETLCENLSNQGYATSGCTSGTEAIQLLKDHEFDLLLTDLMMPNMDGIELLKNAMEIDPQLVGIIMTGQGTIKTAVEAMKVGAFDYILKPFKLHILIRTVSRAMGVRNLKKENIELRGTLAIYELTKAVTLFTDKNIVVDKVADSAMAQCQADEVSVMLPADEGDELYVAAVRGDGREHIIGKRVKVGEGIAGWVAKHHELLKLEGNVDDSRFTPFHPRNDIKNAVSVPMMAGGKFVGLINVNSIKGRSFTPGQIKGLNIIVSMAGPSLENAWLFEQMQKTEEKYRMIFENAVEGVFQVTPDGRFIMANPSMARMLGYASPEVLMERIANIGQQMFADHQKYVEFKHTTERSGEAKGFEAQLHLKDKNVIWVSINAIVVRDKKDTPLYYEGTVEDISNRKRMEEILLNAAREWRTTFDAITDVIWLADNESKILRCNVSATKFFNKHFNEIIGRPCYEIMHGTSEPIKDCPYLCMRKTRRKEAIVLQVGDKWFNVSADPIFDEANNIIGSVHAVSDITSQKRAEEELRELSLKDHLTGLLNHRGFFALAEQQLKLAHRMKKRLVLVFADLDRMKWINDSLGHSIGDLALQETAQVLNETFRESDVIARIGGDEFTILGLDIAHESKNTITDRLRKNLEHHNSMPGRSYSLSLSIGISRYDFENPHSIEKLLAQADRLMYEDKRKKKEANREENGK